MGVSVVSVLPSVDPARCWCHWLSDMVRVFTFVFTPVTASTQDQSLHYTPLHTTTQHNTKDHNTTQNTTTQQTTTHTTRQHNMTPTTQHNNVTQHNTIQHYTLWRNVSLKDQEKARRTKRMWPVKRRRKKRTKTKKRIPSREPFCGGGTTRTESYHFFFSGRKVFILRLLDLPSLA